MPYSHLPFVRELFAEYDGITLPLHGVIEAEDAEESKEEAGGVMSLCCAG